MTTALPPEVQRLWDAYKFACEDDCVREEPSEAREEFIAAVSRALEARAERDEVLPHPCCTPWQAPDGTWHHDPGCIVVEHAAAEAWGAKMQAERDEAQRGEACANEVIDDVISRLGGDARSNVVCLAL